MVTRNLNQGGNHARTDPDHRARSRSVAGASGWSRLDAELAGDGLTIMAPPNPSRGRRPNWLSPNDRGSRLRSQRGLIMKIVVIGGSGLVGSKLVTKLRDRGHETVAASPASGVSTLTGQGLAAALDGASVVVDVSNSPSFDDAALEFFQTSTRNLLAAESAAGVGHHVALSVVGADRLPDGGYLRAKLAQEKLIEASPIPCSIVRATQLFEFVGRIADAATSGSTVRLAHGLIQPIADRHDLAATPALTRLNRRSWSEARVMNMTSPARTPITMDGAFMRPASCRARAIPVPPTMQFTVKIAEDAVNITPRHDDRVPISSSSWTAVRSVGCGKKWSAPGSSVA